MDRDYIEKQLEYIRQISDDDERAHSAEDDFRAWFIAELAKRDDDIGELAKLVASTSSISFARWCA